MKRIILTVCATICGGLLYSQTFTDTSGAFGLDHTFGLISPFCGGASFYDFDQDGWDDLTFASAATDSIAFFKNTGSGFVELDPPPVSVFANTQHILWTDYDNDGDKDLYVANFHSIEGSKLFQNDGTFSFTDVTAAAGLPIDSSGTIGACWADYDKDGYVDLYITNYPSIGDTFTNYLYRNLGDGTFDNVTAAAGVADPGKLPFGASFLDFNNDGWEDIYVYQDKDLHENTLFKNMGDGTFTDVSVSSGANLNIDAMCTSVGDYDNDGWFDIYITNSPDGNKFLHNNGDETFSEIADSIGVAFNGIGWGSSFLDFDNDMDLDLFAVGEDQTILGQPFAALYENDGMGAFTDISVAAGFSEDTASKFSVAIGDFNNDGYSDITVLNNSPSWVDLWANSGGTNNWIKIKLEGTVSNRDGIGSRIEVWTGGFRQLRYTHCGIGYVAQNSSYEIVGVGNHTMIDSIKVIWQSGMVDVRRNLCVNRLLNIVEGETILPFSLSLSETAEISGMANGTATVTPSGGVPPYSYLWDDMAAQTTATATGLPAGTYSVCVTDSALCTYCDTINVSLMVSSLNLDTDLECNLFPNPAVSGVLQLNCASLKNEQLSFEIMDIWGRVQFKDVLRFENGHSNPISLQEKLPSGYYLLSLSVESNKKVFGFMIP